MPETFAARGTPAQIEGGLQFQPKFDADGLIPAIVTEAATGEVLMLAWMNAEALSATLTTRTAHFWSRSRRRLWKKGEESGNVLHIEDLRTDCDQDALWLRVKVAGCRRCLPHGRALLLLSCAAARRFAHAGVADETRRPRLTH